MTTSFPLLAAMAFITYVLLAGMALGIQKRLVLTLLFSLPAYLPSSLGNGCRGLCQAPAHSVPPLASHLTPDSLLPWLQVLPRGAGPVCKHSTGVGVHGGAGPASRPLPGHRTQRTEYLPPLGLQRLQIRGVSASGELKGLRPQLLSLHSCSLHCHAGDAPTPSPAVSSAPAVSS